MPTITITVPESYRAVSTVADVNYHADPATMTNEALLHVFEYGFQRIVNDKCGGKDKTAEDKAKLATAAIARLTANPYIRRASSGESDPLATWVRAVVRDAIQMGKDQAQWKAYKALKGDADARTAMLDAIYDKQSEKAQAQITEIAGIRKQEHELKQQLLAKQAATLANGMTLTM